MKFVHIQAAWKLQSFFHQPITLLHYLLSIYLFQPPSCPLFFYYTHSILQHRRVNQFSTLDSIYASRERAEEAEKMVKLLSSTIWPSLSVGYSVGWSLRLCTLWIVEACKVEGGCRAFFTSCHKSECIRRSWIYLKKLLVTLFLSTYGFLILNKGVYSKVNYRRSCRAICKLQLSLCDFYAQEMSSKYINCLILMSRK